MPTLFHMTPITTITIFESYSFHNFTTQLIDTATMEGISENARPSFFVFFG